MGAGAKELRVGELDEVDDAHVFQLVYKTMSVNEIISSKLSVGH